MTPVCPKALAQCDLFVTATGALDISKVVTAACANTSVCFLLWESLTGVVSN